MHKTLQRRPPLMILGRSPTPTWSRGSNAGSQGEPELDSEHPVPQSTELQPGDDPFMPTTLQVAQTLAGMQSRHDRGNEVSATPPNVPCKALGIDVWQQGASEQPWL